MMHGTNDKTVPYVNGKAVYDRAQSVGLTSQLITMDGSGHVPWDRLFDTYFTDFTTALYLEVSKDAETPDGCQTLTSLFLQ